MDGSLNEPAIPAADDWAETIPADAFPDDLPGDATRVMPSTWIPHGSGQEPGGGQAPEDQEEESQPEPRFAPDVPAVVEMTRRLEAIEAAITGFHERSAHREGVIDRLHEERVEHRGGIRRAILDPVVSDLIRFFDSLDTEARRLAAAGETRLGDLLGSLADDVELALERCGLDALRPGTGAPFQKDLHASSGSVPTDDPAAHNTIAEVTQTGFVDRGTSRARRPAKAKIYRLRQQSDPAVASRPSEDR